MQVIQVNTSNQTTVLQAISENHNVKTGFVCTSSNDIECVDGLCNNRQDNLWWTIQINGDYEHSNSNSIINPDDKVVLKYGHGNG